MQTLRTARKPAEISDDPIARCSSWEMFYNAQGKQRRGLRHTWLPGKGASKNTLENLGGSDRNRAAQSPFELLKQN